jgi:hypothetical protein
MVSDWYGTGRLACSHTLLQKLLCIVNALVSDDDLVYERSRCAEWSVGCHCRRQLADDARNVVSGLRALASCGMNQWCPCVLAVERMPAIAE